MKSGEMTDIPDQSSVTPAPMVDEGPLLFLCHVVAAILRRRSKLSHRANAMN